MFANTDGSWLWASQLSDPRHLAQFEQMYEAAQRDKGQQYRPSLAGYDALIAAVNGLRNDIRHVNRMPPLPGPKTPMDEIKARRKALSDDKFKQLGIE